MSTRHTNAPRPTDSDVTKLAHQMNAMQLEESKRQDDARSGSSQAQRDGNSRSGQPSYTYNIERVIGNGSFGMVYQASVAENGEVVAIKRVFQDKRYKNRELQIMKELKHPNVVTLKHAFFTTGDKPDELYLNVVMEFMSETVYKLMKQYNKMKQTMPIIYVKLYTYQMCRSLAFIHAVGVCHRDIKPQNLLVDGKSHVLKLCDFGSAKKLIKGEPNVSYICSRYYRAPELIFGAEEYTTAIDIWSMGCVLAEMLLGHPLFPGDSGIDQLVEIIKILGTPTKEQIISMNQNYTDFKFPQVRAHPWHKVFRPRTPPEAVDLVSKLLQYHPESRLKAIEACLHPFFDELRDPNTRLPGGKPLPDLFNFFPEELTGCSPELRERLVPEWYRQQQNGSA